MARACVTCHKAKARCDRATVTGECVRCLRLGHQCKTQRPRKRTACVHCAFLKEKCQGRTATSKCLRCEKSGLECQLQEGCGSAAARLKGKKKAKKKAKQVKAAPVVATTLTFSLTPPTSVLSKRDRQAFPQVRRDPTSHKRQRLQFGPESGDHDDELGLRYDAGDYDQQELQELQDESSFSDSEFSDDYEERLEKFEFAFQEYAFPSPQLGSSSSGSESLEIDELL